MAWATRSARRSGNAEKLTQGHALTQRNDLVDTGGTTTSACRGVGAAQPK